MANNIKLNEFRVNATDEEMKQAVADNENLTKDEFKDRYGFTFSAIMNELVEKGFYEKKRIVIKKDETGAEAFVLNPEIANGIKRKTITISEDVDNRLKKLEEDHPFTKTMYICNQIISDGLAKYGY